MSTSRRRGSSRNTAAGVLTCGLIVLAPPAIGAATASARSVVSAAQLAAPAPAPGFQIDLRGAARHIECYVAQQTLRCLDYSKATAPGRCDFGGDVPTVQLARRGRARITYTCVDEGFHDWRPLRRGASFRSGPFGCHASSTGSRLRCASTVSGWSFTLTSDGRIRRGR